MIHVTRTFTTDTIDGLTGPWRLHTRTYTIRPRWQHRTHGAWIERCERGTDGADGPPVPRTTDHGPFAHVQRMTDAVFARPRRPSSRERAIRSSRHCPPTKVVR